MDSVQEDYLSEGEKRSLLSRPSETVSSLSDSKGMILENPDGTFYHGTSQLLWIYPQGVLAGRLAYKAGRIPKKLYATASSPLDGMIGA